MSIPSRAALAPAEALEPAAYYSNGSICSYTTPAQRAFFAFVDEGMTVIPTTARSLDAFARVHLGFTSYVVLNFGGIILQPDGGIERAIVDDAQERMMGMRRVPPDMLIEAALPMAPEVDGYALGCTDMPTLAASIEIETRTGKPALSMTLAMWRETARALLL